MRLRATSTRQAGSGGKSTKPAPSWHEAWDVLQKYAPNAHLWMPGVGKVYGMEAGNWQGLAPAAAGVDVSKVDDHFGGIAATMATAANQPTLQEGPYRWELNGSSDHFQLPPVFQMSDDFCVVAGAQIGARGTACIFGQSNQGNHALPQLMFDNSGRLGGYAMGGGAIVNAFGGPDNAGAGPMVATLLARSKAMSVRRNGAQVASGTLGGTYALASKGAIGAFPTLNPSEFLGGQLYPVIAIKGTVTDADLAVLEGFIREWIA